jgi:glutamate-1-semialdehyde 2,1-aminomutase
LLDEIITFRLGYGGLQEHLGVRPDLTAFGKIIGGGLPIGAFGGRADVMATFDPTRSGTIVHSGTYNGNAATMAAGIATLELFDRPAVAALNATGDRLRGRLIETIAAHGLEAQVVGFGSVMQFHFAPPPITTPEAAARGNRVALQALHLGLLNRGIFSASRQMYIVSTAMDDGTIADFVTRFEDALAPIAAALRAGEAVGSTR